MATGEERTGEFFELLEWVERLESLPRTGWLTAGIRQPESVASHSYEVAVVTLWLADRVERSIETERALRIALLHDLAEALLTDLPKPVKTFVGSEVIADAESRAADRILEELGDGWRDAVEEYRDQSSDEARLVKAADRIQMMAKALTYDAQNRGDVRRFWEGREEFGDFGFPLVGEIFRSLRARWTER